MVRDVKRKKAEMLEKVEQASPESPGKFVRVNKRKRMPEPVKT